jgi:hypothetical protein
MVSSPAMRIPALPALLAAAVLAVGCASMHSVSSSTVLGPGGRAEGRISSRTSNRLRLVNRGPGRVDFVLKDPAGKAIASGSLGSSDSRWSDSGPGAAGDRPGPMVIVLEAWRDGGGAVVEWDLEGEGGAGITWDLSRAQPEGS